MLSGYDIGSVQERTKGCEASPLLYNLSVKHLYGAKEVLRGYADRYHCQLRRFGAYGLALEVQEVESNNLLGQLAYLEGKPKGEKSMLEKRISVKVCSTMHRKSCTHGES